MGNISRNITYNYGLLGHFQSCFQEDELEQLSFGNHALNWGQGSWLHLWFMILIPNSRFQDPFRMKGFGNGHLFNVGLKQKNTKQLNTRFSLGTLKASFFHYVLLSFAVTKNNTKVGSVLVPKSTLLLRRKIDFRNRCFQLWKGL